MRASHEDSTWRRATTPSSRTRSVCQKGQRQAAIYVLGSSEMRSWADLWMSCSDPVCHVARSSPQSVQMTGAKRQVVYSLNKLALRCRSKEKQTCTRPGVEPGPEEFVNLRGLLVQNSKWFDICSVQVSSLVISLSEMLVQLSSGHWDKLPPFSSFSSVYELFPSHCSG